MSDRLRDFLRLIGVGSFLMGMFLLGSAGLLIYNQKNTTKKWIPTTAEVVNGSVYEVQGKRVGHRGTLYGTRWLVRYKIGDSIFDSTADAGFQSNNRETMQKLLDQRPAGKQVDILRSPDDDSRIVLAETMLSRDSPVLRLLEVGAACLVIGLLLIVASPRIGAG